MSDSHELSWSDNPNAPNIPYRMYSAEKTWFAGTLISLILYGMLIVLFFKCMSALFNPVHRRGESVKWGLVSYTVFMFSLVTVHIATNSHVLSISYIDNRDFPGKLNPGPYGYQGDISYRAINVIPRAALCLNNWSADGLLLYRCCIFYSMNLWVIAFPCLMYVASVAMGTLAMTPTGEWARIGHLSTIPYISISLSLNVLLTLMIAVRLVLHGRNVRAATGLRARIGGLYKTIVTMLIESSALFAVCSLLVIIPRSVDSPATNLFFPIFAVTQVTASLLIVQRVANKSALANDTIVLGSSSLFKASLQGRLTGGSGTLSGGHPTRSVGEYGMSTVEHGIWVETVIEIRREKV